MIFSLNMNKVQYNSCTTIYCSSGTQKLFHYGIPPKEPLFLKRKYPPLVSFSREDNMCCLQRVRHECWRRWGEGCRCWNFECSEGWEGDNYTRIKEKRRSITVLWDTIVILAVRMESQRRPRRGAEGIMHSTGVNRKKEGREKVGGFFSNKKSASVPLL